MKITSKDHYQYKTVKQLMTRSWDKWLPRHIEQLEKGHEAKCQQIWSFTNAAQEDYIFGLFYGADETPTVITLAWAKPHTSKFIPAY